MAQSMPASKHLKELVCVSKEEAAESEKRNCLDIVQKEKSSPC